MNSTSSSSPLRRGWGAGLQVPTLSSQNGLFDDQPHPEATSKNGLIRTKDPPITQEIPRGFRSSVSRTRDKNQKDTFLLYHSYPKGLESNLLGHYLQISTLLRNTWFCLAKIQHDFALSKAPSLMAGKAEHVFGHWPSQHLLNNYYVQALARSSKRRQKVPDFFMLGTRNNSQTSMLEVSTLCSSPSCTLAAEDLVLSFLLCNMVIIITSTHGSLGGLNEIIPEQQLH